MLTTLTAYSDWGLLVLRLAVAIIFVYHSMPKLKVPETFAGGMGLPASAVRFLGLVEFAAGLSIGLGMFTQFAALAVVLVMCGAIYYKLRRWHVPFWSREGTGWEFDFILLAVGLFLLTYGPGSIALAN